MNNFNFFLGTKNYTQQPQSAFGFCTSVTNNNDVTDEFRVSEAFTIPASNSILTATRVIMVCDGLIMFQPQDNNPNLLNAVIKPRYNPAGLKSDIGYIIIRGIARDSIVNQLNEFNPKGFTDLCNVAWDSQEVFNKEIDKKNNLTIGTTQLQPNIDLLGVNYLGNSSGSYQLLGSKGLEDLFLMNKNVFQTLNLRSGDSIGFANISCEIEFVLNNSIHMPNIEYLRKETGIIKVTSQLNNNSSILKSKYEKNILHSFYPPLSYFITCCEENFILKTNTSREKLSKETFTLDYLIGPNPNNTLLQNSSKLFFFIKDQYLNNALLFNYINLDYEIIKNPSLKISKNMLINGWPMITVDNSDVDFSIKKYTLELTVDNNYNYIVSHEQDSNVIDKRYIKFVDKLDGKISLNYTFDAITRNSTSFIFPDTKILQIGLEFEYGHIKNTTVDYKHKSYIGDKLINLNLINNLGTIPSNSIRIWKFMEYYILDDLNFLKETTVSQYIIAKDTKNVYFSFIPKYHSEDKEFSVLDFLNTGIYKNFNDFVTYLNYYSKGNNYWFSRPSDNSTELSIEYSQIGQESSALNETHIVIISIQEFQSILDLVVSNNYLTDLPVILKFKYIKREYYENNLSKAIFELYIHGYTLLGSSIVQGESATGINIKI